VLHFPLTQSMPSVRDVLRRIIHIMAREEREVSYHTGL